MNDSMVSSWPREVLKRSGLREAFNADKIRSALARAGQASGEFDGAEAQLLCAQVVKVLGHRFNGAAPTIEQMPVAVSPSRPISRASPERAPGVTAAGWPALIGAPSAAPAADVPWAASSPRRA